MKKLFNQRKEFNECFNITNRDTFGCITKDEYELEFDMIQEELDEYRLACIDKDPVEIADAIGDMLYLVIGTAYKHGCRYDNLESVMNEIHQSNMSKLHKGKVVKDGNGKISKPNTFTPPNINDCFTLNI
jgi:hypothetical protein